MQIFTIIGMFLLLIPLVVVLPIVLIHKKDKTSSKTNNTADNESSSTTDSSFISFAMESEETSTVDPLTTVFYASKNALISWTVDGPVFVDNGIRYSFLSGSWYICGGNGSSISRSFPLNDDQIAIYYSTSQLQVDTVLIGNVQILKTPPCNQFTTSTLLNKTEPMLNSTFQHSYMGRFRICRDDIDMTLRITFLDAISCVKHLFIKLWNPNRPNL